MPHGHRRNFEFRISNFEFSVPNLHPPPEAPSRRAAGAFTGGAWHPDMTLSSTSCWRAWHPLAAAPHRSTSTETR
jgi:hypothetical protein